MHDLAYIYNTDKSELNKVSKFLVSKETVVCVGGRVKHEIWFYQMSRERSNHHRERFDDECCFLKTK